MHNSITWVIWSRFICEIKIKSKEFILLNLIEFIKILLSIMYVDEKIMTQALPLEKSIEISVK
jgi:hypothetical protein